MFNKACAQMFSPTLTFPQDHHPNQPNPHLQGVMHIALVTAAPPPITEAAVPMPAH